MAQTILVVDDNETFLGMLCSLLEIRGYHTIAARSAADALVVAAGDGIAAIVTDVDMPRTDGFELVRQLKEQDKSKGRDIPAWIMTGTLRPGMARKAEAAGAVGLFRKPFNAEEIGRALAEHLGGASDTPPSVATSA